jgi:hypothetical protein
VRHFIYIRRAPLHLYLLENIEKDLSILASIVYLSSHVGSPSRSTARERAHGDMNGSKRKGVLKSNTRLTLGRVYGSGRSMTSMNNRTSNTRELKMVVRCATH